MKTIFTLVMCSLTLFSAAQSPGINFSKTKLLASSYSFSNRAFGGYESKAYEDEQLAKAKKRKRTGIILTSIGGAALVSTITAAIIVGRNEIDGPSYVNGGTAYYDASDPGVGKTFGIAIGGTLVSAGLLGPGIPLMIIGIIKEKHYRNK